MLTGSSTCLFTSLPVVIFFSLSFCAKITSAGKCVGLAVRSLAWFPAPTVELYFQWQVESGHLICSHRQPWPTLSPWPGPPCEQVPGINHTFCWNLINSSIMSFGCCHLYSRINKTACQFDLLFRTKNMDVLHGEEKMWGCINFNWHILQSQAISLPFFPLHSLGNILIVYCCSASIELGNSKQDVSLCNYRSQGMMEEQTEADGTSVFSSLSGCPLFSAL